MLFNGYVDFSLLVQILLKFCWIVLLVVGVFLVVWSEVFLLRVRFICFNAQQGQYFYLRSGVIELWLDEKLGSVLFACSWK